MSEFIEKEPMNIGVILDKTFNFVFKNILWVLLFGVFVSLPSFVIQEVNTFQLIKRFLTEEQIYTICGLLIIGPGTLYTELVVIMLGSQYLGKEVTFFQAFKKSLKKWFFCTVLFFMVSVVFLLGFLLFLVPGFIALSALFCVLPAMLIEDLGPIKAFKRSWTLTKKNRLRAFGYIFINLVVYVLLNVFSLIVVDLLPLDLVYIQGISLILAAPLKVIHPAFATLFYFDLKIRKEAMDLEETLVPSVAEVV